MEGSVFAFDSAFPAAGIFLHLEQVQRVLREETDVRIAVFGHTDIKGSEAHNKILSERRAKAALAMVKRDVDLFDSVAEDDTWGTRQYQVMLRALGCNPGAIDGAEGEMTKAAVRGFQRGYNGNVYHQDPNSPPRAHEDLVVDGLLGRKTKAALRDAYVVSSSCRVDNAQLSVPPSVGCSELNPISDRDEENRRVMIAFIGPDGPPRSDYPCVEGDVGACPRAGDGKMRCPFYRGHFKEYEKLDTEPFFDFRWLREKTGAVHSSALTPLPDGSAQFTIYRYNSPIVSPMPSSKGGEPRPSSPGEALGVVRGEIRGGVAYVRWTPPDDFDPFDFPDWLVDHDHDLELFGGDEPEGGPVDSAALLDAKGMRPPVFLTVRTRTRFGPCTLAMGSNRTFLVSAKPGPNSRASPTNSPRPGAGVSSTRRTSRTSTGRSTPTNRSSFPCRRAFAASWPPRPRNVNAKRECAQSRRTSPNWKSSRNTFAALRIFSKTPSPSTIV